MSSFILKETQSHGNDPFHRNYSAIVKQNFPTTSNSPVPAAQEVMILLQTVGQTNEQQRHFNE
jgi:hypothetical protein